MTKNLVPSLLLDIFGFSVDGLKGSPSHCLSQFSQVFGPWIVRNCGIPPFLRTNHDKSISLPSIQASVAALIRVFHGKKPILMATVNTQISWLNPNFYENKWLSSQFFSMNSQFHGEKPTFSWWKADIFMAKSQFLWFPQTWFFQVYPESCAVSDGCVELSWLELQGLSLAVASHVQQMEAVFWGGNCWFFVGFL